MFPLIVFLNVSKRLGGKSRVSPLDSNLNDKNISMWVLESELGVTTDYLFLTAWLSTQLLRRNLMLRCENTSSPFDWGNHML